MDWGSLLQTASIIIAALSAALGFSAWRRTIIGTRRIELAEESLILFYEARDAIRMMRSTFGISGEGSTRKRNEGESTEEAEILDCAYVVFERYNKKSEIFARLMALRYRFIAYFGPKSGGPFDDLDKIISDIFLAARKLSRLRKLAHYRERQGRSVREEEREEHLRRMHEAEAVFWEDASGDADQINLGVEKVISEMEAICRPIIAPTPTICSVVREYFGNGKRFWSCRNN